MLPRLAKERPVGAGHQSNDVSRESSTTMTSLLEFWGKDAPASIRVVLLCLAAAILERLALLVAVTAILSNHEPLWTRIGLASAASVLGLAFLVACRAAYRRGFILGEAACDRLLLQISEHVRDAELSEIEEIGSDNLLNRVFRDTSTLLDASWTAPMCIFLICSLAVTAALVLLVSPFSAFVLVAGGLAGLPTLRALNRAQVRREQSAAVADSRFLRLADQMISGFVLLKLDWRRQRDLRSNHLWPSLEAAQRSRASAATVFAANMAAIDSLAMITIGALAFILPFDGERSENIAVVALLCSAWGFLNEILGVFPGFVGAAGALKRLQDTDRKLADGSLPARPSRLRSFSRITYDGLSYAYSDSSGAPSFRLGPVDLEINKSEVVFIVGGNGSGKSTLAKLLTGLYLPMAGSIRVDGNEVSPHSLRGLFGGVMSDYHLFPKCSGLEHIDEQTAARLLDRFGLSRVTAFREGRFVTQDLSTGQRKRLALVVAMLENRPILLYDEWASDQDPEFRDLFYRQILPEQKARDITVIAVTHDDRYFDCADRIIQIEYGTIIAGSAAAANEP